LIFLKALNDRYGCIGGSGCTSDRPTGEAQEEYNPFPQNRKYLIPVILTLVMAAYFIQNLFIFEALVTYIPLFLVLGFLAQFSPEYLKKFSSVSKEFV